MHVEYDCAGCGRRIVAYGTDKPPKNGLCSGCDLIGPVRHKAICDRMDGDITEAEFRRRWLEADGGRG